MLGLAGLSFLTIYLSIINPFQYPKISNSKNRKRLYLVLMNAKRKMQSFLILLRWYFVYVYRQTKKATNLCLLLMIVSCIKEKLIFPKNRKLFLKFKVWVTIINQTILVYKKKIHCSREKKVYVVTFFFFIKSHKYLKSQKSNKYVFVSGKVWFFSSLNNTGKKS